MSRATPGHSQILRLLRKQLVPDVARGRGQADAARLAPGGAIDLVLVADEEITPGLLGDKDRIAHPAAVVPVLGLDLFPQPQPAELELGKLLLDLAAQARLVVLAVPPPAARKHPSPIAPPPHQEDA